jgi:hypothetical protein
LKQQELSKVPIFQNLSSHTQRCGRFGHAKGEVIQEFEHCLSVYIQKNEGLSIEVVMNKTANQNHDETELFKKNPCLHFIWISKFQNSLVLNFKSS